MEDFLRVPVHPPAPVVSIASIKSDLEQLKGMILGLPLEELDDFDRQTADGKLNSALQAIAQNPPLWRTARGAMYGILAVLPDDSSGQPIISKIEAVMSQLATNYRGRP